MKILVLSNMYPSKKNPEYGTFVSEIINLLSEKYFIRAVYIQKSSRLLKIFNYFKYSIKSLFYIMFEKQDLILVQYGNHSLLPLIFLPNYILRSKLVINFHGSDLFPESKSGIIIAKLFHRIKSSAHFYIVPSEYFKKSLHSFSFYKGQNVIISPSGGVELSQIQTRNFKRKRKDETTKVGFLGRLERNKGVCDFLKYVNESSFQKAKLEFFIAGSGFYSKIVEYNSIKQNSLTFLGPLSKKQVFKFLGKIDYLLFLSSRKAESLGLVIIEAMASGAVVIALRNGAVEEIIIDGKTGYIIENYSKESIDAIIENHERLNIEQKKRFYQNTLKSLERFESSIVGQNLCDSIKKIKFNSR